jgi:DNA-binding transcriptional MocR family regulator
VSIGHWTFLRVLWTADGLTQRELSDEAGVMEPTTFAALKAMERRGYIVRRPVRAIAASARSFSLRADARSRPSSCRSRKTSMRSPPAACPAALVAATRRTLLALLHNLAVDEARPRSALRRVPSTRELGRLVERAADNVSAEALHRHRR